MGMPLLEKPPPFLTSSTNSPHTFPSRSRNFPPFWFSTTASACVNARTICVGETTDIINLVQHKGGWVWCFHLRSSQQYHHQGAPHLRVDKDSVEFLWRCAEPICQTKFAGRNLHSSSTCWSWSRGASLKKRQAKIIIWRYRKPKQHIPTYFQLLKSICWKCNATLGFYH